MSRKFTLAAAAALCLGLTTGGHAAFAQSPDTMSVRVSYADLNLASQAGAKAVLQRIVNAAGTICGTEPTAPLDRMDYARCVKATTDRAIASVGNPTLTAVSRGENPPSQLAAAP